MKPGKLRVAPILTAVVALALALVVSVGAPADDAAAKAPGQESKSPAAKKKADAAAKKAESAKPDPEKAETEKPSAEKPASKPKPDTVKVKRGPFRIEVELSGVFEAQKTAEIVLRPKQWSELKVLDAVEHGAAVQRGDVLVTLDMAKIDRQIADLTTDLR